MPIVKVLHPYQSYDFGGGLPVILNTGTDVTDNELDQIAALLAAIPSKLRPELRQIVAGEEVPNLDFLAATEQWVLDQLQGLAAGTAPPIKFHQVAPAALWTITHNRNTKPDVVLISDDDGNERVFTDIEYPDEATILVEWPTPTSGWAYIQ